MSIHGNFHFLLFFKFFCISQVILISFAINPVEIQKNQIYFGEVNSSETAFYILNIEKGEEYEVAINFKIGSGDLYGNLSPDGTIENYLKITDNSIRLNHFTKNILINKSISEKCESNCKLILGILTKDIWSIQSQMTKFSLMIREIISLKKQIIEIPLNENIFGSLTATFSELSELIMEPFKVIIPDTTETIKIELISKGCFAEIYQPNSETQWQISEYTQVLYISHNKEKGNEYYINIGTLSFSEINSSLYSLKVSVIETSSEDVTKIDNDNKVICEKENGNFCYYIINIEKNDNINKIIISLDALSMEYNKFEIYSSVIEGTTYTKENLPTKEQNEFKAENDKYLIINSPKFQTSEHSLVLISARAKVDLTFEIMTSFYKGSEGQAQISQYLMPNKKLYYLNQGESFLFDTMFDSNYYIIHANLVFGEGILGINTNQTIEKNLNDKTYSYSIVSKKEIPIKSLKIVSLSNSPACFTIDYTIRLEENFDEILYNKMTNVIMYENQIPASFYIPLMQIKNDYTVNINLKQLWFTTPAINDLIFSIKGQIVNEDYINKKKQPDTARRNLDVRVPTVRVNDGLYDSGLRQASIFFSQEYIFDTTETLGGYPHLMVTIEYNDDRIDSNIPQFNFVMFQVNVIPNSNVENFYNIPHSMYLFSYFLSKENQDGKIINSYKINKRNSNDKYVKIEYSPCSIYEMDFTVNVNDDTLTETDEKLLLNGTSIQSTYIPENGKNIIEVAFPENENTIILSFIRDINKDKKKIKPSLFVFRYSLGETEYKPLSYKSEINEFSIKGTSLKAKVSTITTNDNENLRGEYIMRLYSKNDIDNESKLNYLCLFKQPIATYRSIVKEEKYAVFEDANYTIEGSMYVTVVGIVGNEKDNQEMVMYDVYFHTTNKMNVPTWIMVVVVLLVIGLVMAIVCLYRTVRRYQDKLYGKVTSIDKEILNTESKYGPLV